MAKKPAIANVARPQGFIDDVVLPIAQKAASAVSRRGLTKGNSKSMIRGLKANTKVAVARSKSYGKKAEKAYSKSNASRSAVDGSVRRAEKQMIKGNVMAAKQQTAYKQGNVRKTAKFARAANKTALRDSRKSNVMKMKGLR